MAQTPHKPVRSARLTIFLTPEVLEWYEQFAQDYGFKSRAEVVTYLVERAFESGMGPAGFLKTGFSIQNHCKAYNPEQYRQWTFDWKGVVLPPPPIPTEFLTDSEAKLVAQVERKLKTQTV